MSWRIAFLLALQVASEPALAPYLCCARFRFCICHKTVSDVFFVLYQLPCHFACSFRTLELDCVTRTHMLRSKAVVVKAPFNEVGSCRLPTNDPTGPNYFVYVCWTAEGSLREQMHTMMTEGKGSDDPWKERCGMQGSVPFTSSV